jgi:hypothetical protein
MWHRSLRAGGGIGAATFVGQQPAWAVVVIVIVGAATCALQHWLAYRRDVLIIRNRNSEALQAMAGPLLAARGKTSEPPGGGGLKPTNRLLPHRFRPPNAVRSAHAEEDPPPP